MRRQFCSFGALLIMIVLAFGSVDTSTVNTGAKSGNVGLEEDVRSDKDNPDTSANAGSQPPPADRGKDAASIAKPAHKMNETVHVGYTSYVVWKARWSDRLSDNQFLNQRPNASYLFSS